MPNIPVLLHRPTMEKVMCVILGNRRRSFHTFLDERHAYGQIRRTWGDLEVAIAPEENPTKMGARA
jgi:hypothetical protein